MNLCIDLVLNHTAREHPWAQGWLAGDPAYAGFYTAFPDRSMPDAYDATIPEVFPDRAPGSFTWVPEACGGAGGWVWTTFWPYQWDLDYTNPAVTLAMLGEITWLANRGVDVFRMDAVPFMWKRLGTTCQNQPEGHTLLQLLHALTRLAAPGVVFKAEAIVSPEDLVPYLGGHERYRPECELAYHNQLMVMLWSSLATQDARLAAHALGRLPQIPPSTSWVTYVRGHDDIGWAVSDTDAWSVGVERARAPALPQRLLQRPLPRVVRPRGAVPGERGDRGRADLRVGGLALRHRGRPGAGRRRGAGARDPPARAAVLRHLRLRRDPAALHGRRAGPPQRHRLPRRPRARPGQPLDAPPADGLGRGRPPVGPRLAGGPGVRRAAAARAGAADAPGAARRRRVPGPRRRQRRRPGLATPQRAQRDLRRPGQHEPVDRRSSTPTR